MKKFILLLSLILFLTTEIYGIRIPPQRRENTRDNLRISGRSFRFRLSPSARQSPNGDTDCPDDCEEKCHNGECDCVCNKTNGSQCPPPDCPKDCDAFDYVKDEFGCITCICKPPVTRLPCPPVRCPDTCHPVQPPIHRCPICRCPEHQGCQPSPCPIHCEYGTQQRRIHGCEHCTCRPREDYCSDVQCPTVCQSTSQHRCCGCQQSIVRPICGGYKCVPQCHNGHGYPPPSRCRCPCRPVHRPPEPIHDCPIVNHCRMPCKHGYKRRHGCPSCECEDPPVSHMCHPSICRHSCPHGCYSQSTDCRNYNCLPENPILPGSGYYRQPYQYQSRQRRQSCSNIRATCRLHCPQGYAKDRHGCDTCECKKDEKVPTGCHLKTTCTVFCKHGFQRGPDGCETCLCRQSIDNESKS